MSDSVRSSLAHATALSTTGPGRYQLTLAPGWWLDGTAYGGYVAAVLLRAMLAEADPAQRPLALTVQLGARLRQDRAAVSVDVVRAGSSSSVLTATLDQGDGPAVSATASFGRPRTSPSLAEATIPVAGVPGDFPAIQVRPEVQQRFPLHARFNRRRLPTPSPSGNYDNGGWVRLSEEQPLDYLAVVALLDSWTAPAAVKIGSQRMLTVTYYVQFLASLPYPGSQPADYCLATFSSGHVEDGYAQDDGELWSHSGILLASSRQVVLVGS